MIERCGQFNRAVGPGCYCLCPMFDNLRGTVSTRTNELRVRIETKTADSVFCQIALSVQYMIRSENAKLSFYSLAAPMQQISSFVENTTRGRVATIDLDDLFTSKDEIAKAGRCFFVSVDCSICYERHSLVCRSWVSRFVHPSACLFSFQACSHLL